MDKKFKRGSIILLILLLGLFSILSVNAAVTGITIGVYNVTGTSGIQTSGSPNFAYGAASFNFTNISNNRPFITFNVTTFGGGGIVFNNSFNVTLLIHSEQGSLRYSYVPGSADGTTLGTSGYPNMTVVLNSTLATIYFNSTWADGYYTWALNVSNSTGYVGVTPYNASNNTDYYAVVIDTLPPNTTLYDPTPIVFSQSSVQVWINISTRDGIASPAYNSTAAVGGGFIGFYLRNQSGVLNTTIVARNVFLNSTASTNLTFGLASLAGGDTLSDGEYFFNVSINDSLGNQIWHGDRSIVIDTVNPTVVVSSSYGGTSMPRLATTTIRCDVSDLHPANLSMSFSVGGDDTKGVSCSAIYNSSSCEFEFKPTIGETKEISCIAYDRTARKTETKFALEVTFDNGGSGGGGSGGSGGGGQSPIEVTTVPVVANEPFTYDVGNTYIGVDSVTITSSSSKDVKLTVAGQTVAPADAEFPVIKVYKYFDVTQENLAAEELTSAKIAFTVEDTWLSSNSATKEDVVLQRWNNNEWETYDPTYLGEDQGFHKFEASVPGFSSFVIGLREGAGAVVEPGTGSEEQPGEPSAEGTKVLPIIIVLLVLVVVGAAVWWFVNKKK